MRLTRLRMRYNVRLQLRLAIRARDSLGPGSLNSLRPARRRRHRNLCPRQPPSRADASPFEHSRPPYCDIWCANVDVASAFNGLQHHFLVAHLSTWFHVGLILRCCPYRNGDTASSDEDHG